MSRPKRTTARLIHFDNPAMQRLNRFKGEWKMNNSETIREALWLIAISSTIHDTKYSGKKEEVVCNAEI